jgi:hypothetical protein
MRAANETSPARAVLVSESFQRRPMRIEQHEPVVSAAIPHGGHLLVLSPFRVVAVMPVLPLREDYCVDHRNRLGEPAQHLNIGQSFWRGG